MLPNPDMNFTAFDILTAEEMNELVANIESLSDATGIEDGVILTRHLGQGVVKPGNLDLDKTTVNSWIKYDYGNWQEYIYRFSGWSAPNSFGAGGGSNWTQSRGQLTLPDSLTESSVSISTTSISLNSSWAGHTGGIGIALGRASSTAFNVYAYNEEAFAIANTNMSLSISVHIKTL